MGAGFRQASGKGAWVGMPNSPYGKNVSYGYFKFDDLTEDLPLKQYCIDNDIVFYKEFYPYFNIQNEWNHRAPTEDVT